jgi:hypothetical protein
MKNKETYKAQYQHLGMNPVFLEHKLEIKETQTIFYVFFIQFPPQYVRVKCFITSFDYIFFSLLPMGQQTLKSQQLFIIYMLRDDALA